MKLGLLLLRSMSSNSEICSSSVIVVLVQFARVYMCPVIVVLTMERLLQL
jgi:hypothetical protein